MNGFFITFEGIDGCGKSTHAHLLAEALAAQGYNVVRTAEPGGWGESGRVLRELILHGNIPDSRTEFLLFMADRSAHVASEICPALSAGKIVICERYSDSTLAYQVYGRGFNKQRALAMLNICSFPEPDLIIYLKIAPDEAAARVAARVAARSGACEDQTGKNKKTDRIESTGLTFMQRVADGFDKLADLKESSDILIINANSNRSIEEIASEIKNGVETRLQKIKN